MPRLAYDMTSVMIHENATRRYITSRHAAACSSLAQGGQILCTWCQTHRKQQRLDWTLPLTGIRLGNIVTATGCV